MNNLFPLVTASHMNGWTDLADSFFIVFVTIGGRFFSIYKNESLFPLVTASHVNGWTDLTDSFFIMFVNVRRGFI